MRIAHIKSNWLLDSDIRLDAPFHLSDGVKTKRIIDKFCPYPKTTLGQESQELFKGNIHKRIYVDSPSHGLVFYSASDLFKLDLQTDKYVSKKYSPFVDQLILRKDWILITRSGTLGKVFFTTEDYEGKYGTDDLVRIKPAEQKIRKGYLHAYLTSKYGFGLLTQSGYGGVVKHIEPHHIKDLQIPILPEPKQTEINDRIIESAELRVLSNKFLKKAIRIFESQIGQSAVHLGFQAGKVSFNSVKGFQKRLDGQYQLLWKNLRKEKSSEFEYLSLSSLASSIFVGGRGKRNYVENGVPFLSSSEMMLLNPKRGCKQVSKNNPGLNSMTVSKSDILISRSGTVGNTVLVGDDLAGTAISEHALRLVIDNNKISPNYVFCFLKTRQGMKSMEASSFGSVIITLNEDLIGNIEIPILDKDIQREIHDLIESYSKSLDEATRLENKAIELVENEIESWQKS